MQYRMYLVSRRLKLNYSVSKISRETGLTRQHYSRIECGHASSRLSFVTMGLIARCMMIPLETMFDEEMKYLDSVKQYEEWV